MIRLNRLTDYAVVVLSQMGRDPDRVHTTARLAEDSAVPLPTVSKLMKQLARAGLVTSRRGAAGGYVLSRPAAQITVVEVITALEGPIALTACVDGAVDHCDVEALCAMRGNWNKVNRAIETALASVSLADMSVSPAEMFALPGRRPPGGKPAGMLS